MNDRCHQKTGTFVQKEIVVRIPVTIRLPDDLTRASFIRAAKTNHANEDGLFLEERAAAVTMSMQFGKVSIDVQ